MRYNDDMNKSSSNLKAGRDPILKTRFGDWLKFAIGLLVIAGVFCFFSSDYTPPGIFGEVLRHNRANNIDASPLFYSEVEHMSQLEAGVQVLREEARLRQIE